MFAAALHSLSALLLLIEADRRLLDAGGEDGAEQPPRRQPQPPPPPPPLRTCCGPTARQQVRRAGLMALIWLLCQLRTDLSRVREPAQLLDMVCGMLAIFVPLLMVPAFAPRWWHASGMPAQGRQAAMYAAGRFAWFALPIARSTRAIAHVLYTAQPTPGPVGAFKDGWQMLLGSRTVMLFFAPLFAPTPALSSLLLCLWGFWSLDSPATSCAAPLLQHPLWQRRISLAHSELQLLPLLLRHLDPFRQTFLQSPNSQQQLRSFAARSPAASCRVFVSFMQLLLGVLVPTLMHAHIQAANEAAPEGWRLSGSGSSSNGSSDDGARGCGSAVGRLARRLATVLSRLWRGAEAWLLRLCAVLSWRDCSWLVAAVAWLTTLSFLYCWSLALEA